MTRFDVETRRRFRRDLARTRRSEPRMVVPVSLTYRVVSREDSIVARWSLPAISRIKSCLRETGHRFHQEHDVVTVAPRHIDYGLFVRLADLLLGGRLFDDAVTAPLDVGQIG